MDVMAAFGGCTADPWTCAWLYAAIILGGGAGSRLYPLTKQRAKPAVPIGGAYRLIDVPMSNCINSGIAKIYILTQFNSTSLNRHLARTYNMGSGVRFGGDGFVEVSCPLESPQHNSCICMAAPLGSPAKSRAHGYYPLGSCLRLLGLP